MPSSVNHQSSDQSTSHAPAAMLTSGPLDASLIALHAAVGVVASALNKIVPFPTAVPCPNDAAICEATIDFAADGHVQVHADYTTHLPLTELAALHRDRFSDAGVELQAPVSPTANLAVVHGATNGSSTSTRIRVDDHGDTRRVHLDVGYSGYDPTAMFERAANWHVDAAPVEAAAVDGFEIKSMQNRFRPIVTVIYSTRYRLASTETATVRPAIEHRLRQAGWTWIEPKTDSLFLTGPFDAETHLHQDDADTLVTFVGEFEVPSDVVV